MSPCLATGTEQLVQNRLLHPNAGRCVLTAAPPQEAWAVALQTVWTVEQLAGQRCEVTKYKYLQRHLRRRFKYLHFTFSISFSDDFLLRLPTFVYECVYFLPLMLENMLVTFYVY